MLFSLLLVAASISLYRYKGRTISSRCSQLRESSSAYSLWGFSCASTREAKPNRALLLEKFKIKIREVERVCTNALWDNEVLLFWRHRHFHIQCSVCILRLVPYHPALLDRRNTRSDIPFSSPCLRTIPRWSARAFPADCPHFKIFTASRLVLEDARSFQHMAEFFNYNHLIVIADIHRGLHSPARAPLKQYATYHFKYWFVTFVINTFIQP